MISAEVLKCLLNQCTEQRYLDYLNGLCMIMNDTLDEFFHINSLSSFILENKHPTIDRNPSPVNIKELLKVIKPERVEEKIISSTITNTRQHIFKVFLTNSKKSHIQISLIYPLTGVANERYKIEVIK